MPRKVVIAMSGGIDSSVAAALLKEAKFDVVGIFMKLDELKSSKESEKRARAVAKKLGISFQILDIRKEFKKKVIKPFIVEYKKGRTPNPCVICNKEIKFKFLFKELRKLKADFFATGHYVRIKKGKLLKARDKNKDQSYFLWQLIPKLLNNVLFPIGGYTKKEVKQLAKNFKLPTKDIPESQEVCFIETTTSNFLKKHLGTKAGRIINTKSEMVGEHQGLWFYTIGQRKGIKLSGGPFYVLDKNVKENLLIVTQNKKDLYKKELVAKNINWISGNLPKFPLKAKAKIRYRHQSAAATIMKQKSGKVKVIFSKPQKAITPGQSVVFYSPSQVFKKNLGGQKGQEVLGGGMIEL